MRRLQFLPLAAGFSLALAVTAVCAQEPAQSSIAEPAADVEELFPVWEYRVLGSKVLPRSTVERAVYTFLGPQKSIDDIEAARVALETAYRNAGFNTVFVDIPEQSVENGVVRLNVTEGKLDRLRVTGARYFSNRRILARLPALTAGDVPHFPDFQRQLSALNQQTPDRVVTPVLRAGRFPGTVDVELRVADDSPLHGSVELNDRHTASTSELRSSTTLSYNNLWQRAHTATLQYQVAPENRDEAEVLAATYVARLEDARTLLAFYAVDSSSDVATVGTLSVLGQGNIFGVRGIRLLDPQGAFFHNVTLGIDAKDFDENIRLDAQETFETPIKYVNWSANYTFGWNLPKSTSSFGVGSAWGLRGFGNDDAEFENKRFDSRANYAYLTGSAEHSRQIFGNARFTARFGWQYADGPLISNEQFSAGGATTVRGYLEAEELGDRGANLALELYSPSLVMGDRVDDLRLFGFMDFATLRLESPLPDQDASRRLKSVGAGLRFSGLTGLQAELDWAKPLVDGSNVPEGDDRVHFRLLYQF